MKNNDKNDITIENYNEKYCLFSPSKKGYTKEQLLNLE